MRLGVIAAILILALLTVINEVGHRFYIRRLNRKK
jgi:membrane-associated protease RseP (regulator of RpoE activity)